MIPLKTVEISVYSYDVFGGKVLLWRVVFLFLGFQSGWSWAGLHWSVSIYTVPCYCMFTPVVLFLYIFLNKKTNLNKSCVLDVLLQKCYLFICLYYILVFLFCIVIFKAFNAQEGRQAHLTLLPRPLTISPSLTNKWFDAAVSRWPQPAHHNSLHWSMS